MFFQTSTHGDNHIYSTHSVIISPTTWNQKCSFNTTACEMKCLRGKCKCNASSFSRTRGYLFNSHNFVPNFTATSQCAICKVQRALNSFQNLWNSKQLFERKMHFFFNHFTFGLHTNQDHPVFTSRYFHFQFYVQPLRAEIYYFTYSIIIR